MDIRNNKKPKRITRTTRGSEGKATDKVVLVVLLLFGGCI